MPNLYRKRPIEGPVNSANRWKIQMSSKVNDVRTWTTLYTAETENLAQDLLTLLVAKRDAHRGYNEDCPVEDDDSESEWV